MGKGRRGGRGGGGHFIKLPKIVLLKIISFHIYSRRSTISQLSNEANDPTNNAIK